MRPLHLAAYFNQPDVATILINANADVNAKDNRGKTIIGNKKISLYFINLKNSSMP